jgi:hypothetical protein
MLPMKKIESEELQRAYDGAVGVEA